MYYHIQGIVRTELRSASHLSLISGNGRRYQLKFTISKLKHLHYF